MIDLFVPVEIVCILSVAVVAGFYKTSNKSKLVLRNEIKAREKVEEEYRQALVFSETMLESSPAGILAYSTHTGQCVQANQAAAEILGGTVEKLLLQQLHAIPLMQEPDFNALVRQTTKDGTTRRFERNYTSSFGKTLFIHCSVSRFYANGVLHFMLALTDLTEQRRLLEEIRNFEAKLLHVQKLESLGVMAGGIAHDFNNILTAIMGNAELGRLYIDDTSPAILHMDQIEAAAERAAELAKQMLDYSGKGRYEVTLHSLNQLIKETGHMLQVSISKKASLIFELAPNIPPVACDATQIRQVIMNLVINASEALSGGEGEIHITTGISEAVEDLMPGSYVFFEVSDTGCGMSQETLTKIFDPYFTTKFTGRGLGMSAVVGIASGHQGTILVRSELGGGTTFRVVLPSTVPNSVAVAEEESSQEEEWSGKGTVLLVDDEKAIRDMGKGMLRQLGFDVITAVDGRAAMEVFEEHHIKIVCVILDLTMPRMDGSQTFRAIREIRSDMPVVVASGYTQDDIPTGTNAFFIQKPYNLVQLQAKIQKALGPA